LPLTREFELMNIKEYETNKDYYSRIKELVNQIKSFRKNIHDEKSFQNSSLYIPHEHDNN